MENLLKFTKFEGLYLYNSLKFYSNLLHLEVYICYN